MPLTEKKLGPRFRQACLNGVAEIVLAGAYVFSRAHRALDLPGNVIADFLKENDLYYMPDRDYAEAIRDHLIPIQVIEHLADIDGIQTLCLNPPDKDVILYAQKNEKGSVSIKFEYLPPLGRMFAFSRALHRSECHPGFKLTLTADIQRQRHQPASTCFTTMVFRELKPGLYANDLCVGDAFLTNMIGSDDPESFLSFLGQRLQPPDRTLVPHMA